MKKFVGILAFIGVAFTTEAQVKATVSGEIVNGAKGDSIFVSRFMGNGQYVNLNSSVLSKDGKFSMAIDVPTEDFYVFRYKDSGHQLIVRANGDYKIYGDAKNFNQHSNIVGSEESDRLQKFFNSYEGYHRIRQENTIKAQQNPLDANALNAQTNQEFEKFKVTVNEYYQSNVGSPALIGLLNVLDPEQDFGSYEIVVNDLMKSFPQSPTVQGVAQAYQVKKMEKDVGNPIAVGKVAPDFEELMLDRKTKMKLSDLKGKVVLLDFWASWCGPCRKENPHVVALYDKYKDKGFTVMSVSLDDNLDRWKQAIEQDNLKWPNHVSDLKKWQSAAGAKYAVKSIPFTVLIDQEGKIIQTNLRGADLERVVSQLLGK